MVTCCHGYMTSSGPVVVVVLVVAMLKLCCLKVAQLTVYTVNGSVLVSG